MLTEIETTKEDVIKNIQSSKPTVTSEMISMYTQWTNDFGSYT